MSDALPPRGAGRGRTGPATAGLLGLAAGAIVLAAGCQPARYRPELARDPYPQRLHTTSTIDVQVFREDTVLVLVNATARSYENVRIWLNQRYVDDLAALPAGETVRMSLWDFFDERGEGLNAGGLLRTERPDRIVMVEMQVAEGQPLVGLMTIPDQPPERRRDRF